MEIGVFIPIGNNGWLISSTSPQYTPSFDLNREVVLRAEKYGFDFALSMIKLRGFGGPSRFWDDNLESLTLMAGLASITTRIELMATVAVLTLPPALCARKAMTIDSISHGRFGVNLVTGWQKAEYDQMGLWPGDDHYKYRYDLLTAYATIMQELWGTGRSDLKGKHYTMNDCRLGPLPSRQIPLAQETSSTIRRSGTSFWQREAHDASALLELLMTKIGTGGEFAYNGGHEKYRSASRRTRLDEARWELCGRPPLFFHYFKRYRGVTIKFPVIFNGHLW